MSDNLNTTPELTLTLDGASAAQAVPEAPSLTLQPEAEAKPQADEAAQLQAQNLVHLFFFCRQNKETVSEFIHCFFIHIPVLLFLKKLYLIMS